MDVDVGELFGELTGYCGGLGILLAIAVVVSEGDGLVWWDSDTFAGDGSDFVPEFLDVGSEVDG